MFPSSDQPWIDLDKNHEIFYSSLVIYIFVCVLLLLLLLSLCFLASLNGQ